jgi:monoamine oxidase
VVEEKEIMGGPSMDSQSPSVEHHDVLILGAGVAGLAAAATLASEGVDVSILDARRRVGGRVWTLHATEEPIELGAEFVHGDAPRTTALAHEGGIDLIDAPWTERWDLGGELVDAPECERLLHEAVRAASAIDPRGPDRSLLDALRATRVAQPVRALALEYVQNFQAGAADRLSARALAAGDLGGESTRRVAGGYDGIVRAIAARVPPAALTLGRLVESIRWSRDRVEVLTAPTDDASFYRTFTARRAIVTLPLGVLPHVRFDPPLMRFEDKATALRHLATGHALRLVLRFQEPFWQRRIPAPAFIHVPGDVWPVFWTGPGPHSTQLVAWAGGPAAQALEVGGRDRGWLAARALDSLSTVFGVPRRTLKASLIAMWIHDWTQDPLARGAYSYPMVGGAATARALATPLDDTLYFAGEATVEPPANGTVEGALESGARAAREVLGVTSAD